MAPHQLPIVGSRRTSGGWRAVAISDVASSSATYALVAHTHDRRLFVEDLRFCLWRLQTGNLGRDPELLQPHGGEAVTRLSIATNEVWMKAGEHQRRTEWHRVVVWGPRAERTAQLRKGMPVYVEGRLRTRTFTNADNVEQMRTEIHSLRLMPLRSRTQREATTAAPEGDGFRDGDAVPF
jgi:single-strand DNA-binding protein